MYFNTDPTGAAYANWRKQANNTLGHWLADKAGYHTALVRAQTAARMASFIDSHPTTTFLGSFTQTRSRIRCRCWQ